MDIAALATRRYTTKTFDATKRIPEDELEQIKTLLRYSPSSVNSQPWHFILASSNEAKQKLTEATMQFAFNTQKLLNASHVLVLCRRTSIDDAYLNTLLTQEELDGRIPNEEVKNTILGARKFFVGLHTDTLNDANDWMEKQVYLALGTLLLGAAALDIDACPIEGFDAAVMDKVLGLEEKGLHACVMVALGYRAADDFNAVLPKSRLPQDQVLTEL
ncbi:MAG: oxygen-insensitive NAD(P)H nitroreductase [Shewanella sp.]|nr:oxygen-insensitive NAD(P)H nitroreductase [Shewanella sp.]MCF1430949.1 oxygen-insensitive NAD(P)H nitroreductase [Shewanella sp.]MCF1438107.1 oxygen-insensitive NAD(P)H nitroreductase [Shewanella sp.]MCF1458131.1 oxygen-insensitive NAD(P)H nitroreductase [Shewanella sp.]